MTRNDDELDGYADLSARQRAAVDRFQGRTGRHQRDRVPTSNAQQWADFARDEIEDERRRFGPS